MASRLGVVWSFISHYKYLVVIVLGVIIVGFIDENSFMRRIQLELKISDLRSDINKYNKQYQDDSRQLREIRRNPKTIEKIARERYFMKADDEDIYVLSDDEKPLNTNNETTE
ncbi:MAG: FtsB family cell division protein [Prevotella sp.]|jgi:cell division protein FtsB|nr:septum formation initiator family protein [Prevotella sp.]MBP8757681.1 septum formation initiator family protein [Prevotella sp.]MBP9984692.1 septum formation initiator family protein [Prevotella sp.]MDY0153885.1 septum formation initiator family protein [Prevotella sp.]